MFIENSGTCQSELIKNVRTNGPISLDSISHIPNRTKVSKERNFRMDEWNSKIKKDEAKKKTTYNWNEEVMKV